MPAGWQPSSTAPILTLTLTGADGQPVEQRSQVPVEPVVGWLDGYHGVIVNGWACNLFDRRQPLLLDIWLDDQLVDRIIAQDARDDLAVRGLKSMGFSGSYPRRFSTDAHIGWWCV